MASRSLRRALETYLFVAGRTERASDRVIDDRSVEWTLINRFVYWYRKENPLITRIVLGNLGEIRTSQRSIRKSGFIVVERYDAQGNTRFPQLIVPKVGPPRIRHDREFPASSYSRFHAVPDDMIDPILNDLGIRWIVEKWG